MTRIAALPLFDDPASSGRPRSGSIAQLSSELRDFQEHGTRTVSQVTEAATGDGTAIAVDTFANEFWTNRQRAPHSLHEISYPPCFKPHLTRLSIERRA